MAEADERRELLRLNLALGATIGVVVLFMILASVWGSGAVQNADDENYSWWDVPLHDRHKMELDFTGLRSQLPVNGSYNWSGPTEHFVEVDLPASEQDAGYPEPALMHVALWLPDVPEGQKIPVIATIHPYSVSYTHLTLPTKA